ncbi:MAG TPA: holo-ACP synthase [Clostridiaceae bacterium]|nr:holo-ACP synthase [Clostridiaceae bacterium]
MRIGVDLISVKRLEEALDRHLDRFMVRVFTERERDLCSGDVRRLAGRFASKEAVSKALGTGIGRHGITFQDIEIGADDTGAPFVILHGAAKVRFTQLEGMSIALSISHENEYAVAFCVIETETSVGGKALTNGGIPFDE